MKQRKNKYQNKLKKKIEMANKLVKLALNDKFKVEPAKGFMYLKDVNVGELVTLGKGNESVLIEKTNAICTVLVIKADNHPMEDRNYYLGKQRWALETEVKHIGD